MSNGKHPLMLMMALAMPGAASALGLGEIHVESGLNERLAAEIDIVGATAEDLMDLRAAVANRETFLRYGADRPAFLASATFKVAKDSQGRPVLAVSSTDSFSEPLVNFLVDLRWHKGEIVREYTLLLDPPGFGPAAQVAQADRPTGAATSAAVATTPMVGSTTETTANAPSDTQLTGPRQASQIKVGANATLRGIAWRVGARSESDLRRMMIAIFRANPSAFDGNINRLYLGAVLSIPSDAALAAISNAEAKREFHAQMAAWHGPTRKFAASDAVLTSPFVNAPIPQLATAAAVSSVPASPVAPAPVAAASPVAALPGATSPAAAASGVAAASLAANATATGADAATTVQGAARTDAADSAGPNTESLDSEALNRKVQALEKELANVNSQLDSDQDKIVALHQRVEAPAIADATQADSNLHRAPVVPIIAGLGLLAALAGLYWRIRRRARKLHEPHIDIPAYREVAIPVRTQESVDDSRGMTVEHTAYEGPEAEPAGAARQSGVAELPADNAAVATTPSAFTVDAQAMPSSDQAHTAGTPPSPGPVEATQPMRSMVSAVEPEETTINLRVDATRIESTRVEPPRLDYNLLDLDMTAAQHVQMPSELHEPVMKERRRNLADVLKLAIEREPDRQDLRMKLLEFYYSAAATNRQGFFEVVQQFARERDRLEPEVWEKIAFMGRQIAPENPLFAETAADDDLANCA